MKKRNILAIALCALAMGCDQNDPEVVYSWNELTLQTVRDEGVATPFAARTYAMVNIAMYDAVNGIATASGSSPRAPALVSADGAPNGWHASAAAAAAAAAHAVLTALHPELSETFDAALEADLDAIGGGSWVDTGAEWGASVGAQVVELRATDGSEVSESVPGGTDPGQFRADFGSVAFRNLAPFAVDDPSVHASAGPPALDSTEYADALNEVRELGDGSVDDPGKNEIVRFWRGSGGTARPPGEWVKVALTVAQGPENDLSLREATRLFALLGMGLSDAVPVSWSDKDAHTFWRPTTAINNADDDGNAATVGDPAWTPRNGSIGSSPEHTSGQSTFAGVGSTVLAGFFCEDEIEFTFEGDPAIAGPRTFESFSEAAAEAGRARIFAGIHFEFSNQAGQAGGRGVGDEVLAGALLRQSGPTHNWKGCPR